MTLSVGERVTSLFMFTKHSAGRRVFFIGIKRYFIAAAAVRNGEEVKIKWQTSLKKSLLKLRKSL